LYNWLYQDKDIFEHFNCKPMSNSALGSRAKPSYTISVSPSGKTPLVIAQKDAVKDHLKASAKEKLKLHKAAEEGKVEDVSRLLDVGAEINAVDSKGRTALYLACEKGHADVVRVLLDRGAGFGSLTRVVPTTNQVSPQGETGHFPDPNSD
jgi:hypothetical protein